MAMKFPSATAARWCCLSATDNVDLDELPSYRVPAVADVTRSDAVADNDISRASLQRAIERARDLADESQYDPALETMMDVAVPLVGSDVLPTKTGRTRRAPREGVAAVTRPQPLHRQMAVCYGEQDRRVIEPANLIRSIGAK